MINLIRKLFQRKPSDGFQQFGKGVRHSTSILWGDLGCIKLDYKSRIWEYAIIRAPGPGCFELGANSRLGPFSIVFAGQYGVIIGEDVMIAPHCVLAAGNHNYKDLTTPMVSAGSNSKGPIKIGNDVWIGANCTIADGVTIGKGAVIAANSFVNTNINEYDIVAGNPVRKIKSRFDYKK